MDKTSTETRTIVITGATGGIGYQSALGIANTGARVIITGRNQERGEAARQRIAEESGNGNVELVLGDVSSMAGVDALAKGLLERLDHIDVLVNNAGYLGSEKTLSDDGLEMHFAVNVLAPRRLTLALLPALKAAANPRVLNVTGGDKPARIDADNLQAEKGFKGLMTYTHSKSVLESMTMTLAKELEPEGVSVNVIFPGRASTAMTSSLSSKSLPGPMKIMLPLLKLIFRDDGGKSAAKAATSTIWGATTSDLDGVTGKYFDTNTKERKLHATAYEPEVQARILAVLENAASVSSAPSV
jgi:NAD(P)-dependent dehydrogenase (short-subunit alcohol dehydrogenase family)